MHEKGNEIMIQLNFNTSSNHLIPIADFKYIYELARCAKCQYYILLKETNTLYGFPADCSNIHEIYVPFEVNTDLIFGFESISKEFLLNESFFIPSKYKFIVPSKYWDKYLDNKIYCEFDVSLNEYILLDENRNIIESVLMNPFSIETLSIYNKMLFQLEGFFTRLKTLNNPITFKNMQENEVIRYIYDNKIAVGRSLIKLSYNEINIAFYIYKSMFSLAKSDTLDLEIRTDIYQSNIFMATFIPHKARNPISKDISKIPFTEKVHCMYINIHI